MKVNEKAGFLLIWLIFMPEQLRKTDKFIIHEK